MPQTQPRKLYNTENVNSILNELHLIPWHNECLDISGRVDPSIGRPCGLKPPVMCQKWLHIIFPKSNKNSYLFFLEILPSGITYPSENGAGTVQGWRRRRRVPGTTAEPQRVPGLLCQVSRHFSLTYCTQKFNFQMNQRITSIWWTIRMYKWHLMYLISGPTAKTTSWLWSTGITRSTGTRSWGRRSTGPCSTCNTCKWMGSYWR